MSRMAVKVRSTFASAARKGASSARANEAYCS
jgi:hypothetical protein